MTTTSAPNDSTSADPTGAKRADLAGPGIGSYEELERVLPSDYHPLLTPRETQEAIFAVKRYIEDGLCRELGLMMVQVPLIVDADSGVNDMLDRDGSRTPIQFHIANDHDLHPVDAQVVQAATKWKRLALEQFGMAPGEGLCTDMRAVRKDYFLDHDHSAYVDQWDWERAITPPTATSTSSRTSCARSGGVLKAPRHAHSELFPALQAGNHPDLPDELVFLHAEEILARYPDLPRKQRETAILQEYPAVFIIGIGWTLADGYPHEMRAADYDDWVDGRWPADGRTMPRPQRRHPGLEPVTRRRHELTSMGIRVDAATLRQQLELTGPARLADAPLPPRHHRDGALPLTHRRRHRPVPHADAAAAQGAPRRGERHRVAAGAQGHLRGAQHRRPRVTGDHASRAAQVDAVAQRCSPLRQHRAESRQRRGERVVRWTCISHDQRRCELLRPESKRRQSLKGQATGRRASDQLVLVRA